MKVIMIPKIARSAKGGNLNLDLISSCKFGEIFKNMCEMHTMMVRYIKDGEILKKMVGYIKRW